MGNALFEQAKHAVVTIGVPGEDVAAPDRVTAEGAVTPAPAS
ncbi:hypothetical protein [Kitasatospora purpeofusca]|uniref:Uncharacterized protein n=1 Tax=Kitasatospora purpeofusca TaxID=67352 RepID=A0ABZ1TX61_9ACTN|nr:hypothetical protein [Kitasatospora purpeofusca]